jgi:hypothetical protein
MNRVTHYLALLAASITAFLLTPAGQALLLQYPKLASLIAGATWIAALYRNPKTS